MMPSGARAGQLQCDNRGVMGDEMYGIVSVLDDEHQETTRRLWADIEREFGVRISETHVPHFSYHVATTYGNRIHELLDSIAATTKPVRTSCMIIGVFNFPPPLFFLPLARTDALNSLHRRLWTELEPYAVNVIGPYYGADLWMATVNLAPDIEKDISRELLPFLLQRDFQWNLTIDNVSLLHDTGERQVLEARFDLRG
jgi:hypothetical protein